MAAHYVLAECIGDALRAPGDSIAIPRGELEAWLAAAQALECEVLEHREREAQREVAQ